MHYVGSIAIDHDLMQAADILEGEQVDVVDVTNGARLTTYAITRAAGSGVIELNGAAAHLIRPNDLVFVMFFRMVDEQELVGYAPRVVHVDEHNRIVALGNDPAQPAPGALDQYASR